MNGNGGFVSVSDCFDYAGWPTYDVAADEDALLTCGEGSIVGDDGSSAVGFDTPSLVSIRGFDTGFDGFGTGFAPTQPGAAFGYSTQASTQGFRYRRSGTIVHQPVRLR